MNDVQLLRGSEVSGTQTMLRDIPGWKAYEQQLYVIWRHLWTTPKLDSAFGSWIERSFDEIMTFLNLNASFSESLDWNHICPIKNVFDQGTNA
jgi:hypothetical protein